MKIVHDIYMQRCIELATNGLGTTYPNPMVGSVIVHDQKIIGEGWHRKSGEAHAEVIAIQSVKNKSLLKDATIYVNLEPCSHYGKTPPCSDLIIENSIKNVVIGTADPFLKVSGRGIKKLMEAGCSVTLGVLENECKKLNKRFFTYHTKKRPYIILKWAKNRDNFIAPENKKDREPVWITNEHCRQLVHKWRSEEQAILVGSKTVIEDNPKLTVRDWKGKNPIRVVIDPHHRIPKESFVFDTLAKTLLFTNNHVPDIINDQLIYEPIISETLTIEELCKALHRHNIQSIIIEGGATTLQAFIDSNLWDEARVFEGPVLFGSGIASPIITGKIHTTTKLLDNTLTIYTNDSHATI